MNKNELASVVSEKLGCSKADASKAITAVMDAIVDSLVASGKAKVSLGTIKVVTRKGRVARNPQTGDAVNVPEHKTVKLVPSTTIKEILNK